MTEFFFSIDENADLKGKDWSWLINHFKELKAGRYKATIAKAKQRSLQQNDYYWLILTEYVQPALYDAGWREIKSKHDAHEFTRSMFLKEKIVNEVTGEVIERTKSTTELTTIQFMEYLEEIWQWAAEYLSITIPAPNTQTTIDYYESDQ